MLLLTQVDTETPLPSKMKLAEKNEQNLVTFDAVVEFIVRLLVNGFKG